MRIRFSSLLPMRWQGMFNQWKRKGNIKQMRGENSGYWPMRVELLQSGDLAPSLRSSLIISSFKEVSEPRKYKNNVFCFNKIWCELCFSYHWDHSPPRLLLIQACSPSWPSSFDSKSIFMKFWNIFQHKKYLEPYFYLSLWQTQVMGDLYTSAPREVAIKVKLLKNNFIKSLILKVF